MTTTVPTRRRKALAALLLLPVAGLALAGCVEMDMQMELYADDTAEVAMTVVDRSGLLLDESITGFGDCDALLVQLDAEGAVPGASVREVSTEDDRTGCELTVPRSPIADTFGDSVDGAAIRRDGDVYHLSFPSQFSPADVAGMPGFEVSYAFTFPGDVLEAGAGTVSADGRTVSFGGDAALQDIVISGEAGSTGVPLWSLGVVGVVLAGAVAAIVVVLARRRGRPVPVGAYPSAPGVGLPLRPSGPTPPGG